jgi:multisubunit Na+/H+ antiporter MnhE subunit
MALMNPLTQGAHRQSRHPLLVGLTIVLTPGLWILFVGTSNPHELMVGLACSVATIVFTLFVCRFSSSELEFRPRDLMQGWRIPWYIVSGVYEITLVLAKDLLQLEPAKSLYRVCGFDTSAHDPVRAARTVLAVAYTTTAPNFIVIGVDPAQSRMLFHQIESSSVPKMTQALGAKS